MDDRCLGVHPGRQRAPARPQALSPKPVFFTTNRTAQTTIRRVGKFLVNGNPIALPGIFASALRG
jgi:hypothetical protein